MQPFSSSVVAARAHSIVLCSAIVKFTKIHGVVDKFGAVKRDGARARAFLDGSPNLRGKEQARMFEARFVVVSPEVADAFKGDHLHRTWFVANEKLLGVYNVDVDNNVTFDAAHDPCRVYQHSSVLGRFWVTTLFFIV